MTTVVVGLDGAHWELLNPWIKEGYLPNLKRIQREGAWGDLQSCLPPVTSPNWKCYATGKNPGKLGVYWWEIVDTDTEEIRSPTAEDFQSAELWDYLNRDGLRTAVLNMPTTYPPTDVDGVLVAGGPDAPETGYTNPASLEETLDAELAYRVHPEGGLTNADSVDEATIQHYLDAIDSRFDLAEWTVAHKKVDFVHVTTFYVNVFQHYYWDHEFTRRAWERIDARLGDLMADGHDLLLLSDHGSTEIEWEFNLNRWLEEEGYLVLNDDVSSLFARIGLTRHRTKALLSRLPFRDALLDAVPQQIKNTVPNDDGRLPKSTKNDQIDWTASRAVASGQGPVYVLVDDPDERATVATEIESKLADIRDPDGNRLFADVHRGEEIYHGPHTDLAPALVVEMNPGYHVPGSLGGDEPFTRPRKWRGENKHTGLFAAWGDDIATTGPFDGTDGEALDIVDLTPTILHWLGCAVPADVDGTVRTDIFEPGSDPAERNVEATDPLDPDAGTATDETQNIEDRLESLGYK